VSSTCLPPLCRLDDMLTSFKFFFLLQQGSRLATDHKGVGMPPAGGSHTTSKQDHCGLCMSRG
jgi:hypothetical protein